ncbi:MAG: hypothetical protein ACRDTM_12935, partial [Micromonosporaceae bacterium]
MPGHVPTPIPGSAQLLELLDGLPVSGQRDLLLRLAREHSDDLATLIGEWAHGGTFQRRWAAVLATQIGAAPMLEPLLSDPTTLVRRAALTGWLTLAEQRPELVGPLTVQIERWPRAARQRFPYSVNWRRLPRVAGALLPWVRRRYGDETAAWLLPWCEPATITRMLPVMDAAGELDAGADGLVARHPELLARWIDRELTGLSGQRRSAWWGAMPRLCAALSERRPDLIVWLLDRHLPDGLPAGLIHWVPRLLPVRTEWTLRRLADPETRLRFCHVQPSQRLRHAVAELDGDALTRLMTVLRPYPDFVARLAWFWPGEPRAVVYDHLDEAERWRLPLEYVPVRRRPSHVRELLAQPETWRDPDRVRRLATRLPFPEAYRVLVAARDTAGREAELAAAVAARP